MDYSEHFEALRAVYLEDSWVLSLEHHEDHLVFLLDVVLTPRHPSYVGARPGEQHDYRQGRLLVRGSALEFTASPTAWSTDKTGEPDGGNIDVFASQDGVVWELEGDWGEARVREPVVELELVPRP